MAWRRGLYRFDSGSRHMLEIDRLKMLDPLTEALRKYAQAVRFLERAAQAELCGDLDWVRDYLSNALAWESSAWCEIGWTPEESFRMWGITP